MASRRKKHQVYSKNDWLPSYIRPKLLNKKIEYELEKYFKQNALSKGVMFEVFLCTLNNAPLREKTVQIAVERLHEEQIKMQRVIRSADERVETNS